MLEPAHAKHRQRRLLDRLAASGQDAILITQPQHVYYLTGHRPAWRHLPAFILRDDGRSTLICANSPTANVAADTVISYPANLGATLRQDQASAIAGIISEQLIGSHSVGFDASETASMLDLHTAGCRCIDDDLCQLRRAKDPDELQLMQRAIDATKAMYHRARQIIEPGITEIDVFNQLHAAAVESTCEPMTALLGNDFACGAGGGPPRAGRKAQDGELYILDLGPTYRGYFADNARVICVNRKPTDAQYKAWQAIVDVFPIIESLAKPGVRCRDLYAAIDEHFQSQFGRKQFHHLGHGVGLQAHEFPHLNPHWDDTLIEGEIFTAEPGFYADELHAGLRIENQYVVTASGVRNLTPFAMEMT